MPSPSTWSRVVRELGLKRNRIRIYPAKPKTGIRASGPGQIWPRSNLAFRPNYFEAR